MFFQRKPGLLEFRSFVMLTLLMSFLTCDLLGPTLKEVSMDIPTACKVAQQVLSTFGGYA
eukprot:UN08787